MYVCVQRCVECNGNSNNCRAQNPATDGTGLANVDYALYISANQNECPSGSVAFAGACHMESTLDRPISGYINFCPDALEDESEAFVFNVAKHELLHALAFSSQLFPFFRDANGQPRTARENGLPPFSKYGLPPVYTFA